jgi:ABC-2 type transport system ATP-binding protein
MIATMDRLTLDAAEAPADAAIRTEGLRRTFPSGVALEGLDLYVRPGEVLALLGPNGAGKTTTVRLLNGILRPDGGTASVMGHDPSADGDAVRRLTGVLTENAGLDDRLTVRENLLFPARVRGMGKRAAEHRARELCERFGLADRFEQRTGGFSTGQRKRLALARALIHEPQVLFLDEPTSGLDPSATRDVVALIGSLAAEHGRTIVLCTHFLGEAGRLADRIAVLDRGRLHAFGRPGDLAARLWDGVTIDIELGRPWDPAERPGLPIVEGGATPTGCWMRLGRRDGIPALVRELVAVGLDVYAVAERRRDLEEIYFAVEARIAAGAGAVA